VVHFLSAGSFVNMKRPHTPWQRHQLQVRAVAVPIGRGLSAPSSTLVDEAPAALSSATPREDLRRRQEIGLAFVIVGAGIGGCGVVLASGLGELWRWQVPVLLVCALGADAASTKLANEVWSNSWSLFAALTMAFLGPAATFAVFGLAEACVSVARRSRPFAGLANTLGCAGVFLLGAVVMRAAKGAFGYSAPGFYIVLAVVLVVVELMSVVAIFTVRWLRWHERPLQGNPVRALLFAALINTPLAVAAARVYAGNNHLGLALMISIAVAFSVMIRLIGHAQERADENAALAASRAVLLAQLLEAEDRERRQLAEELHDDAVQNLLAVGHDLEDAISGQVDRLGRAQVLVKRTVEHLRGTMSEMHPSVLAHAGLEAALTNVLEAHAARRGFAWEIHVSPDALGTQDRLVFSLTRELIANAAWHAHAAKVSVRVEADAGNLVIVVSDDGVGFDPEGVRPEMRDGHMGLASVQQRATAAGGSVTIDSRPGRGTTVTLTLAR
jgi:signal transduction histidine kinase